MAERPSIAKRGELIKFYASLFPDKTVAICGERRLTWSELHLRGRALAGVQGNKSARIFCLDLQAELVSIAGDYKTSEHMTKQLQKKPMQVYLQDHALIIKEIA